MSTCSVYLLQSSSPESELKVTHLLDPVTGKEACYLFDNGSFLETTRIEDDPSSWFVNDQVIQDGSLYLAARIHPLFLCIPFFIKSDSTKYLPLSDVFLPSLAQDASLLQHNDSILNSLDTICDVKMNSGDKYYRFEEAKCIEWLKTRVAKVEPVILESLLKKYSDHPRQEVETLCHLEAIRLMGRYISPSLFSELLKAFNIAPKSLEMRSLEKKKWGIEDDTKEHTTEKKGKTTHSTTAEKAVMKRTTVKRAVPSSNSITSFFHKKWDVCLK